MFDAKIEAGFENGVFRPLGPVELPEHQRVTLLLPTEDMPFDDAVDYKPLPFEQCKTTRVRLKRVGDFGPLPYPIESEELEQE